VLVVRGFGKTYGVTGWRLGYAAGPAWLVEQMIKLQQYTYVCAPSAFQWGVMAAMGVDMSPHLTEYQRRRDLIVDRLSKHTELAVPGGAFYAFVKVPERLGYPPESAGEQFFQRCARANVLIVPGRTFSSRDTHFRLSYATPIASLQKGLDVIAGLMS
jgi:aspartate/methionine/tyrosine aminotransferase